MWKLTASLILCGTVPLFWGFASTVQSAPQDNASATESAEQSQTVTPKAQKKKTLLQLFMREKLSSSNRILEGLVVDDLKMVSSGADALLQMSVAEEWRASNDMLYRQHSREFQSSVQTLRDKADQGSIDGVALAWVDVTLNCVQCHEWVRNMLLADTLSESPAKGQR